MLWYDIPVDMVMCAGVSTNSHLRWKCVRRACVPGSRSRRGPHQSSTCHCLMSTSNGGWPVNTQETLQPPTCYCAACTQTNQYNQQPIHHPPLSILTHVPLAAHAPPSTSTRVPLAAHAPPSTSTRVPLAAHAPPSTSTRVPLAAHAPSTSTRVPLPAHAPSTSTRVPLPAHAPSTSTRVPLAAHAPSTSTRVPLPAHAPSTSTCSATSSGLSRSQQYRKTVKTETSPRVQSTSEEWSLHWRGTGSHCPDLLPSQSLRSKETVEDIQRIGNVPLADKYMFYSMERKTLYSSLAVATNYVAPPSSSTYSNLGNTATAYNMHSYA